MATTWIKPLKVSKTMAKSSAVAAIIDYVQNPQKTDNGRLITSYACDSRSADDEFMLAKKEYEYITGRNQGRRDVIAYHMRQSFKPGEIDPETANKIGYELAMSFTKGRHAVVVCTHIDKAHIHNHIIFNSTSLDCERKFKNFWRSDRAIRRISDLLCAENGLSIIENPQQSKGSYGDWLGNNKPPAWKDVLKQKIDEVLPSCQTFEDFLAAMIKTGYTVNASRKYISLAVPGQKKPTRMKSLGDEYTEEAIRARLGMVRTISGGGSGLLDAAVETRRAATVGTRPNLLIDIQAKLRDGKGAGYAQWAKIFNLKEAAKTLVFLKENGIDSYEELVKKASKASGDFAVRTTRIKEIEARQKEIAELQKQIGTYGKTRDIYAKYKASGWSRSFYDIHAADIILHRAAKKYFDELGMKKLPSINQLTQEYGTLAAERKTLYGDYHSLKDLSRELSTARANAERILGITPDAQNRDTSRNKPQHDAHDI
jgi:hypothetical protein